MKSEGNTKHSVSKKHLEGWDTARVTLEVMFFKYPSFDISKTKSKIIKLTTELYKEDKISNILLFVK